MSREISKQEIIVYEEIKVYLQKRRPIEIDKLIPFLVSRLSKKSIDINSRKVKLIVKSFLKENRIVEGSRLTKDEILENDIRRMIFNYINEHSAVYFHQIVKNLDLPSHSVIWHLNLLFLFNFINKVKIEKHYNHYIYHLNNLSSQEAKKLYFTKMGKCEEIIEYVKNNPDGCTKTRLSKQLGMHPNTIKKYIDILEDIEVLIKQDFSNKSLYYLNL